MSVIAQRFFSEGACAKQVYASVILIAIWALPHFRCRRSSARAVIPLEKKEVLGWLLTWCRFAIGATREIDKCKTAQCLALISRA